MALVSAASPPGLSEHAPAGSGFEREAAFLAEQIRRVLRPSGTLVICEETDVNHRDGDVLDPNGMGTIGRSVGNDLIFQVPDAFSPGAERRSL